MAKILQTSIPGIRAATLDGVVLLLRGLGHQVHDEGEPRRGERLHRHRPGANVIKLFMSIIYEHS
jgi:hypothetical protein